MMYNILGTLRYFCNNIPTDHHHITEIQEMWIRDPKRRMSYARRYRQGVYY